MHNTIDELVDRLAAMAAKNVCAVKLRSNHPISAARGEPGAQSAP
jgi:hypothetical protein